MVDYKKFDKITDDSDEEEKKTVTVPKKANCANCGSQGKLRACTACKKVSYCSTECQKKDWQFHRRTCGGSASKSKKAVVQKPKKKPVISESESSEDDGEPLTWYRHRETKLPPSQTGPVKCVEASPEKVAGSAWNAAGTWEERDVSNWANEKIASLLREREYPRNARAEKVEVKGDANVGVIRGKTRHICDLSVVVSFKIAGKQKAKVTVSDLTSDERETVEVSVEADNGVDRSLVGPSSLSIPYPPAKEKTLAHDVVGVLRDSFIPAFKSLTL